MIGRLLRKRHSTTVRLAGGLALTRNKQSLKNAGITHLDTISDATCDATSDAIGDATSNTLQTLAVPDELVVPLIDYHRRILHTHLRAGDSVRCGDRIAAGLIAPASGTVSAVESRKVASPHSTSTQCVVIKVDHERDSIDSITAQQAPLSHLSLDRVHSMGVSGLGGAGFPTDQKLNLSQTTSINTLIINGAECEPVIACDEAIMQIPEQASDIVRGIGLLINLTKCQRCVLVIEEDKIQAIAVMRQAVEHYNTQSKLDEPDATNSNCPITLLAIAPIYPSGAERPLVELVTGTRLAPQQQPADIGSLCLNVATAESVARALDGFPLINRVITVAGDQAHRCVNVKVRLGTSIEEVLRQTENSNTALGNIVRIGGPLSGYALEDSQAPVTSRTNCITVDAQQATATVLPCIRCGDCEDVCPTHLAPQQLYWFGQSNSDAYLDLHQLDNCIECGCCDLVCPSRIPLTDTFRQLRGARQQRKIEAVRANLAEDRYQAHSKREEHRALEKEKKRVAAQAKIKSQASDSDDVLARIKRKRDAPSESRSSHDDRST